MSKRKVLAVRYHRNGACGESFFTVRFTDSEAAKSWELPKDSQFLAVVPSVLTSDEEELAEAKKEREGACYVVALAEPELTWRGDRFEAWAVAECQRASEDMSAHHDARRDAKMAKTLAGWAVPR